jgi:TonB family protein
VIKVSLARSSGNPLFDNAVMSGVERSSPFPPPPDALRDKLARDGVVFNFTP